MKLLNNLLLAFKVSRFRFWSYIAGTYLVGFTIAASNSTSGLTSFNLEFFISLLFFTTIANILLYGINDYFDYETDVLNSKKNSKTSKEYLAKLNERKDLLNIVIICILLSLLFTSYYFYTRELLVSYLLLLFLFLSIFYSSPPLRFKSKPFFDFASNFLYIVPGIVGYVQISKSLPNYLVLLALFFWTSAMQLYSAVPDIVPDKKAKIKTTAVVLGHRLSLILCTIFWTIFYIIIFYSSNNIFVKILCAIYPVLSLVTLVLDKSYIHTIYWFYPYINSIVGFLLFALFAIKFF
jgi:4-hydroxybenzoate polyprenyltransferase